MGQVVANTANIQCSFGLAPSVFTVLPVNRTMASSQPAATIMDQKPFMNIPPFGMCTSMANPTVMAATIAAFGALTPMPCTPVVPAPWMPGSPTVTIGGVPALTNSSQCVCAYGGAITIMAPGQFTVQAP